MSQSGRDQFNNPVAGAALSWKLDKHGDLIESVSVATGTDGTGFARWTAATSTGARTLQVRSGDVQPLVLDTSVSPGPPVAILRPVATRSIGDRGRHPPDPGAGCRSIRQRRAWRRAAAGCIRRLYGQADTSASLRCRDNPRVQAGVRPRGTLRDQCQDLPATHARGTYHRVGKVCCQTQVADSETRCGYQQRALRSNDDGRLWRPSDTCHRSRLGQHQSLLAIACAKPMVLPCPPRSGVKPSLASSVAMMAARRRWACSGNAR